MQMIFMKKVVIISFLFAVFFSAKSQTAIYGTLDDAYRDFMIKSHTQFDKLILNDFMGVGGEKRFMSNYWLEGEATNNFEVSISRPYKFNYDFLGHELHAKWKDTSIVVNTNYVRRFLLIDNFGEHVFVKAASIDPQGKYFFESLAYDATSKDSGKVQLLKLRTIKKIKANKNDYVANFNGDFSDELDETIEYYLVTPQKSYSKVKLNKRSILDALGTEYKAKADAFFKSGTINNESSAAALIRIINQ